jgi:predicted RNA-binding Zn-ribbon protein involved in translation (DUF1610 family)
MKKKKKELVPLINFLKREKAEPFYCPECGDSMGKWAQKHIEHNSAHIVCAKCNIIFTWPLWTETKIKELEPGWWIKEESQ